MKKKNNLISLDNKYILQIENCLKDLKSKLGNSNYAFFDADDKASKTEVYLNVIANVICGKTKSEFLDAILSHTEKCEHCQKFTKRGKTLGCGFTDNEIFQMYFEKKLSEKTYLIMKKHFEVCFECDYDYKILIALNSYIRSI